MEPFKNSMTNFLKIASRHREKKNGQLATQVFGLADTFSYLYLANKKRCANTH
jgi:hypothetical protein